MSDISPDLPPLATDSRAVLADLTTLRQRDGMSVRRLQQNCPAILLLRATEDERNRMGLAPADRHVAAMQMLRCAVQFLIKRTDLHKVLVWTLNMEGESGGLEQRRLSARSELFLQSNAYARLEAEAYQELAAVLVLARESPCGGLKHDLVTLELTITARAEDLSAILNLLSLERRENLRQALSQAGLRLLPNALDALAKLFDLATESPIALLQTLVDAVLRRDWNARADPETQEEPFFAESMQRLIFGQAKPFQIAREEERHHRNAVLAVNGLAIERFFVLYEQNLTRLTDSMKFAESLDLWDEYLRGTSSGDREPEPLPTRN